MARMANVMLLWEEVLLGPGLRQRLLHWRRKALHVWVSVWVVMPHLELGLALLLVASSSIHTAVPPVLHGIVATAMQSTSNLGPSLAHLSHHHLDSDTFFGRDGIVIQVWLQVLVISLATLLRRARLNGARDSDPVRSPILVHEVKEEIIFGLRPGTTLVLRHCEESGCLLQCCCDP